VAPRAQGHERHRAGRRGPQPVTRSAQVADGNRPDSASKVKTSQHRGHVPKALGSRLDDVAQVPVTGGVQHRAVRRLDARRRAAPGGRREKQLPAPTRLLVRQPPAPRRVHGLRAELEAEPFPGQVRCDRSRHQPVLVAGRKQPCAEKGQPLHDHRHDAGPELDKGRARWIAVDHCDLRARHRFQQLARVIHADLPASDHHQLHDLSF